ncbi:MAG: ParA family protein, partial [Acidobacteria bacterium]|nr:ParA family protein [Acidobacteriota bacterium]
MVRLVISNQRGGVAKTTTTATLARFFGDRGMRVLIVDADPQGSLGIVLGLRPRKYLYEMVVHNHPFEECITPAAPNIDVICGNRDTTRVEAALLGMTGGEFAFVRLFGTVDSTYDAVLIDVAPSISLVQTCSMMYAKRLLIPVAMDMLSLQGAVACLQTTRILTDLFQTEIRAVAMLPVMIDRRFGLTSFVLQALEEMSGKYSVPLLHSIRTDATVPRAQRARMFLADYDPGC